MISDENFEYSYRLNLNMSTKTFLTATSNLAGNISYSTIHLRQFFQKYKEINVSTLDREEDKHKSGLCVSFSVTVFVCTETFE